MNMKIGAGSLIGNKTFPKCKIYKGSLIQQIRQYIKDLNK